MKNYITYTMVCLVFSGYASGYVKRPLIIARTSGSIVLEDGRQIRVFGFAGKLSEMVALPGTVIEVEQGDSIMIDFWNVSQGDPHDIEINGIDLYKQNQRLAIDADKGVRHMEHGYYSFVADRAGTYIYYCKVNYPFNIQAGMFGILIVKPKKDKYAGIAVQQLWCGYEIDTNWHTDAMMDIERGERDQLEEKPVYNPQYFAVNSIMQTTTTLNAHKGESVLIRLANAGLMEHVLTFPEELTLHVLTKNAIIPPVANVANMIVLKPLETCEILVSSDTEYHGTINYVFKNEGQDVPIHVQKIPVSITR